MKFREKLLAAAGQNQSWLCVGLDPDPALMPEHIGRGGEAILQFNRAIIESTFDLVCAYKPNAAFYEVLGAEGWTVLAETIKLVPDYVPVILDFKRGDIGNTARMYAEAAFGQLGADAVTVSPYMGEDSVKPFLDFKDKGTFILCLTSNPSSADIQKKALADPEKSQTETSLYRYVARLIRQWDTNDNAGIVVGATSPDELGLVRHDIGDNIPILIPGVGAQGGDLEKALQAGSNAAGRMAIINVARGVVYAGKGEDFRQDVRRAAEKYRQAIIQALRGKLNKHPTR